MTWGLFEPFKTNFLFGILRIPPFGNHKGKDVNSDWLADQWDERSVLGHAPIPKGGLRGDDPEIDTAQTPKRFERRLVLLEKTLQTFTDSIPNNFSSQSYGLQVTESVLDSLIVRMASLNQPVF